MVTTYDVNVLEEWIDRVNVDEKSGIMKTNMFSSSFKRRSLRMSTVLNPSATTGGGRVYGADVLFRLLSWHLVNSSPVRHRSIRPCAASSTPVSLISTFSSVWDFARGMGDRPDEIDVPK